MSVYLKHIEQLVELQKVDDAIFLIRKKLTEAPRELAELEKRFSVLDGQRTRIVEKLEHLREQQKRISLEIDDDSTRLKKSRSKLMQVETTREYHAMLHEMDSMEKLSHTREEEHLAILEEVQRQEAALAEIDSAHSALKARLDTERDSIQEKLEEAQASLAEKETRRGHVAAEVPAPVFRRYEFIRKRLEHPVIVPVTEGVCSGCHIAIPPQTFIELQRGQQILSCPNCQRLIYWSEHFRTPENETASRPPQTFFEDTLRQGQDA